MQQVQQRISAIRKQQNTALTAVHEARNIFFFPKTFFFATVWFLVCLDLLSKVILQINQHDWHTGWRERTSERRSVHAASPTAFTTMPPVLPTPPSPLPLSQTNMELVQKSSASCVRAHGKKTQHAGWLVRTRQTDAHTLQVPQTNNLDTPVLLWLAVD